MSQNSPLADPANYKWDTSKTPNVTPELFATFYTGAVSSYASACYALALKGGFSGKPIHGGCWGGFPHFGIPKGPAYMVAIKYRHHSRSASNLLTFSDSSMDESGHWFIEKVLLHKKYSPWKDLLKYLEIVRDPNGFAVGFILETEHCFEKIDKYMVQNFNLASRGAWDFTIANRAHAFYTSFPDELKITKKEAVVFGNLLFKDGPSWLVAERPYNSFLKENCDRWLKGIPNSTMSDKKSKRFVSLREATSGANDLSLWGEPNSGVRSPFIQRAVSTLLKKTKKSSTVFGNSVKELSKEAIAETFLAFREDYIKTLKNDGEVSDHVAGV